MQPTHPTSFIARYICACNTGAPLITIHHTELAVQGSPLPCLLSDGTTCPPLLCPSTSITFRCTLPLGSALQGFTVWKLPSGTCSTKAPPNQLYAIQDSLLNCANNATDSCGRYRGQIEITCRTSTLSVTVTAAINGSEVKCFNSDHAYVGDNDPLQPVGSARVQLVPAQQTGERNVALTCTTVSIETNNLLCSFSSSASANHAT